MAEAAPSQPDTQDKPKKKKKPQLRTTTGPTLTDRIIKNVSNCKDRKGLSYIGLKKALAADGYDVERNYVQIKRAIKRLLENGVLKHTKGNGMSGSFKLVKTTTTKPAAQSAKGTKKTPAQSAKGTKKTPAKPTKDTKKKTDSKAKKSAAKKPPTAKKPKTPGKKPTPKKATSPKKTKKVIKKTTTPKKTARPKASKPRTTKARKPAKK